MEPKARILDGCGIFWGPALGASSQTSAALRDITKLLPFPDEEQCFILEQVPHPQFSKCKHGEQLSLYLHFSNNNLFLGTSVYCAYKVCALADINNTHSSTLFSCLKKCPMVAA